MSHELQFSSEVYISGNVIRTSDTEGCQEFSHTVYHYEVEDLTIEVTVDGGQYDITHMIADKRNMEEILIEDYKEKHQ